MEGRLNDLFKKSTKQCILILSATLLYCGLCIPHFFYLEYHKKGVTIRIHIYCCLNKVTINFVIQHIPQKQEKKKIYLILIYIYIQAENGVPKKKTRNFVLVLTSYKMSNLLNRQSTSCWKGEVTAV